MHGVKRRQWTEELREQKRRNDKIRIKNYRTLQDKILKDYNAEVFDKQALQSTEQLLRLNPEFNTVWNYRRAIILAIKKDLDLQFWNNELVLSMELLKDYPKNYWIWSYRVWTLINYPESPLVIWQGELKIVNKFLEMDQRNYHCWHYRRILLTHIEKSTGETNHKDQFEYTTTKINKDISNFSAWHQRVSLIPTMLKNKEFNEGNKDFIMKEFDYITNAMFTDPEDQSVWLYIKWFINCDEVVNTLNNEERIDVLTKLRDNILLLNNDELEFSGKENNWCLKMLIVIERLHRRLSISESTKCNEDIHIYLEKLIIFDPLRANRYKDLLKEEESIITKN